MFILSRLVNASLEKIIVFFLFSLYFLLFLFLQILKQAMPIFQLFSFSFTDKLT